MSKPQAIIFDYGRVLVGPLDFEAFDAELDALATDYGFPDGPALWNYIYISDAWEQAKRGVIPHETFWDTQLRSLGVDSPEAQRAFKGRLFRYWGLYPEMRELLDVLKGEYRLAVLSNTSRKGFTDYLNQTRQLQNLFDVVVSSAEEGAAKPEPEIYYSALEKLELQPENVLFIDDLKRNTDAAAALGIPSIVFTSPGELTTTLEAKGLLPSAD